MNKLKVFFLVCVIAGIAGCTHCDDCNYTSKKIPAYANKSRETVKIIASGYDYYIINNDTTYTIYEKIIANGDTLHNYVDKWYVPTLENCGLAFNCDSPSTVKIELHFLEEPVKCLIFDGPIKNDGIDTRSIESYKKGGEIHNDPVIDIEYVYTITPEIRAMAKEEYCPLPVGSSGIGGLSE